MTIENGPKQAESRFVGSHQAGAESNAGLSSELHAEQTKFMDKMRETLKIDFGSQNPLVKALERGSSVVHQILDGFSVDENS